jgi:probable O-glycosylation ligase (exosortase A-associated)
VRDLVILGIILASLPFCFRKPFFGVLMWEWIALFNPHRYAWSGLVYNFPVALAVAVPTLLGLLSSRKFNRNVVTRESILILLLWLWMCITVFAAAQVPLFEGHIQDGVDQLIQITKILLMTFVTLLVVDSEDRLRKLVLVMALSLGMRGLTDALFGLRTGGQFRVYGAPDSFMADNNDFALALNMILPLLYFAAGNERNRWVRMALRACFFAGIFSVILTYSRGGLLGLATVLVLIAAMSRYRIIALSLIGAAAMLVVSFAPQAWTDRMHGMVSGQVDSSAKQRLIAWETGWNLVMDYPITGGGLSAYPDVTVFRHYQPEPMPGGRESEGPHSIYFQVLGEQGFPGLALFIFLLGSCMFSMHKLRGQARRRSRNHWAIRYTRMFEVSLAAFVVSGAFLGRAYFDLWYEIAACVVVVQLLYRKELRDEQSQRERSREYFEREAELSAACS